MGSKVKAKHPIYFIGEKIINAKEILTIEEIVGNKIRFKEVADIYGWFDISEFKIIEEENERNENKD